jgi:hypothetical protein
MLKTPPCALRGGEHGADDVADVDEVTCLQPVAEDERLVAAVHALEEDRDDAALERRVLPRSVHVPESLAIPYGDTGRRGPDSDADPSHSP